MVLVFIYATYLDYLPEMGNVPAVLKSHAPEHHAISVDAGFDRSCSTQIVGPEYVARTEGTVLWRQRETASYCAPSNRQLW